MPLIPVRLRVGCHVTDLGELEADEDPADAAETYRRLAALLDDAVTDLRERVIPEVLDG